MITNTLNSECLSSKSPSYPVRNGILKGGEKYMGKKYRDLEARLRF